MEASNRVGGRIKDDDSLGNCIGLGAQIITGCINNPLFVMCEQVCHMLWIFLLRPFCNNKQWTAYLLRVAHRKKGFFSFQMKALYSIICRIMHVVKKVVVEK